MPWLAYTTAPTTWTIDLSDGTYWHYASFNARLKALTLSGLMHWLFYEVAARIPPRAAARMTLMGGYHWLRCPRPAARALVGSLHALLTQVVARCERGLAQRRYLEAHPDAPQWRVWSAAELCAATEAEMHHDAWCAYRRTKVCDCTKLVEQRALRPA